MNQQVMDVCTGLLKSELRVAMGCTEPIALAYCAAYARTVLGKMPDRFEVRCSGNIIKNVKAVTVPKTGGLKGIEAAVLSGAVSGRADLELEVLSVLSDDDRVKLGRLLGKGMVKIELLDTSHTLHIVLNVYAGNDSASVEIIDTHTSIGRVTHNGVTLHTRGEQKIQEPRLDRGLLSVKAILSYAETVPLEDVNDVLRRQIECNTAISEDGLAQPWGERVGDTLTQADNAASLYCSLKAAAAAGSDARMNGCALPVVINSGSGNQGLTASLPVICYAKAKGCDEEKILRALCVSNLVAIHQKTVIGYLSAYCGAVCAATGSAAAIAWLEGADYQCIVNTIINSIATVGGMVCDGAKSSCASKIAVALESSLLGYEMAKKGRVFRDGEGLVKEDVEETIANVGRMASRGMRQTDTEILNIMIGG